MFLTDSTDVANLALDHLGEPYLEDLETDTGTTADVVRRHYDIAVLTVLEGHVWSFATRTVYLTPATAFFANDQDEGFYTDPGDFYTPAEDEDSPVISNFSTCYLLPSDCLRLIKINGVDIDAAINRFDIQGRYLLTDTGASDPLTIDYIVKDPPVLDWPATFADAVSYLLASRMAPKLTQDQNLSGAMLQKHEIALGKARSKDARETRSKENSGPRAMAARSGLVLARYGTIQPPV